MDEPWKQFAKQRNSHKKISHTVWFIKIDKSIETEDRLVAPWGWDGSEENRNRNGYWWLPEVLWGILKRSKIIIMVMVAQLCEYTKKKKQLSCTVFYNFIYLFLAVLGLRCCLHRSSSGVRASHCGGFSCCRAWALGHADFSSRRLWALEHGPNIWWKGFIDPRYVGSSWIRDQTPVSCIGRQILYYWTCPPGKPLNCTL